MNLYELAQKSRSYRRYDESRRITQEELYKLCSVARFCPSTTNLQSLRFLPVSDTALCDQVFSLIHFAALLKDWHGPAEGQRPTGYILILSDLMVCPSHPIDVGVCAQTILLAASEAGYGGCMLGNIHRKELLELFNLDPERYQLELVLSLGLPGEEIRIVDLPEDGNTVYYRDARDRHCVPKRSFSELILTAPQA